MMALDASNARKMQLPFLDIGQSVPKPVSSDLVAWFNDLANEAVALCVCSIYTVHDEVKDKAFILDLSWIAECQ